MLRAEEDPTGVTVTFDEDFSADLASNKIFFTFSVDVEPLGSF